MENTKTLFNNIIDFLLFGFKLYRKGTCDKRMQGEYNYVENSEIRGYTKSEASKVLGISERQFDRRIKQGKYEKGRKYRNVTTLYWDKEYIDKMSKKA